MEGKFPKEHFGIEKIYKDTFDALTETALSVIETERPQPLPFKIWGLEFVLYLKETRQL